MPGMSLIKKGSGLVVILAIAFNLFCSSLNDIVGACPMNASISRTDASVPPCHGENGESSNESASPCCSPEIADGVSQPELRLESEHWFKFPILAVLFSIPIDFVLEPISKIAFFHTNNGLYDSDHRIPLSLLQVFLI